MLNTVLIRVNPCLKKPRIVAFEVTRRCEMNCIHCRASACADFRDDLTTEQCKKIIKSIADYNRCVLIFTGGEPLERDDIFELIDYAVGCRLIVSLATCGYNFDEEIAARLKGSEVSTFSFSLDSADAAIHDNFRRRPGAFEKTLAAISIARKSGLKFQINTTVTKLNFRNLTELAELSDSVGAYCFNPFMLVPAGRAEGLDDIALSPQEYEQTLKTVAKLKAQSWIEVRFTCAPRFSVVFKQMYPNSKKKAFGCLAAGDFAFISYRGDVQTCGFLEVSAGNILDKGDFGSIWEKSDFLNSIRQMEFKGGCGNCHYTEICGGCRARAYTQSGDYLASDPLCSYVSVIDAKAGIRAMASTLIAAHIEEDRFSEVADAVNSLPNVSHNYLRNHYYNLWFTLKAADFDRIGRTVKDLSGKFKTDFFSFPAVRRYKLDSSAVKRHNPPDNFNALFCCRIDNVIARSPKADEVYPPNVRFARRERGSPNEGTVSFPQAGNLKYDDVFQSAVKYLCDLPQVSHCYERQTHVKWPYNLYAMIHGGTYEQIEKVVADFVKRFGIEQFAILPTIKSLKK